MPVKPQGQARDPQHPGILIDPATLQQKAREAARAQQANLEAQGIRPGPLGGAPPPDDPNIQAAMTPAQAERPEPAIPQLENVPEAFKAGQASKEKRKHPVLAKLEQDLGLVRLEVRDIILGGHRWTFRPMGFIDYEWMAGSLYENKDGDTPLPSLTVCSVASCLTAIDGSPVYEVFDVDVSGRHIADPNNPPPDIRRKAADAVLLWFREGLGMWELIAKLDEQMDLVFESQRSERFPLWGELASPGRQRMLALRLELAAQEKTQTESSTVTPAGLPGGEPWLTQGSSPRIPVPENSGTTDTLPASLSTGVNASRENG